MKYKNKIMTAKDFIKLKKSGKIKLDRSFQVGTDTESRWGQNEMKRFLASVMLGSAPSAIILVDVRKALDYNIAVGIDNDSIEYFEQCLKDGYEYVSVDGNNRSITFQKFADGDTTIKNGEYEDERGLTITAKKGSNKYDTLNKFLRKRFDNTEITVCVYTEIREDQLNILFRNVNDGIKLNPQQLRQSHPGDFAEYIRDKRDKYEDALRKFFSNKDYITLISDEFLVKCAAYATFAAADKTVEVNKSLLNDCYTTKKAKVNAVVKPNKSTSVFNRTINLFLNQIQNASSLNNLKGRKNAMFDLFQIMYDYAIDNVKIDKPKEFFDLWLETAGDLVSSPEIFKYKKTKSCKKLTSQDYSDMLKHAYTPAREERKRILVERLENIAFKENILIKLEDPDDYFSYDEKYIMWKKQKGVCPRTNKKIPIDEIGVWTKWQGDAVFPKNKGGIHELSNGQLICAKFNKQKSDKLI